MKTQRWPENTPRFHVFHDVPSRCSPVGVTNLAYIENCGEIQVRKRNFVRPLLISNKCHRFTKTGSGQTINGESSTQQKSGRVFLTGGLRTAAGAAVGHRDVHATYGAAAY